MGKIVFTGGGSAGHVTPNLAIIRKLQARGWEIAYIGSTDGIEKQLIEQAGDIPYHAVSSGKLRRYFDLKNFRDPFKVMRGVWQSYFLLKKLKPDLVFSKGGFVSVPVIMGSWLNRIPVIIHESDLSPGLANKLSIPFAKKVCVTFAETMQYIPSEKAVLTGSPIRSEIFAGEAVRGLEICGFHTAKPVLLIMGGSQGSQMINTLIRDQLDLLLARFQIIHICGQGNTDRRFAHMKNYKQFEYVNEGLADMLAAADVIVSRAGANAIFEFLALKKPMLLIPLSKAASRGDQLLNARSFEQQGFCIVIHEEELAERSIYRAICDVYDERETYIARMEPNHLSNSTDHIIALIEEVR